MMGKSTMFKQGPHGILAKVKVLDTGSGLCFESNIYPEEIVTNNSWTVGKPNETIMTFSSLRVPEIRDWNAEWGDSHQKLNPLRDWKSTVIEKIIFSGPCTIILWEDGTKTIAKVSEGEEFDPEKSVAVCFMKKIMGHTETNKLLRKAHDQYNKEMQKLLRERADMLLEKIKETKDE